jgi:hypothetical protein
MVGSNDSGNSGGRGTTTATLTNATLNSSADGGTGSTSQSGGSSEQSASQARPRAQARRQARDAAAHIVPETTFQDMRTSQMPAGSGPQQLRNGRGAAHSNPTTAAPSPPKEVTTLLITHVPNFLTQGALLSMFEDLMCTMRTKFDFFYCPWDEQVNRNLGYALINFPIQEDARLFQSRWNNQELCPGSRGVRPLRVIEAALQGRQKNMEHFSQVEIAQCTELRFRPLRRDHMGLLQPLSSASAMWQCGLPDDFNIGSEQMHSGLLGANQQSHTSPSQANIGGPNPIGAIGQRQVSQTAPLPDEDLFHRQQSMGQQSLPDMDIFMRQQSHMSVHDDHQQHQAPPMGQQPQQMSAADGVDARVLLHLAEQPFVQPGNANGVSFQQAQQHVSQQQQSPSRDYAVFPQEEDPSQAYYRMSQVPWANVDHASGLQAQVPYLLMMPSQVPNPGWSEVEVYSD